MTARVQAGRALRAELKRVNQLQGKGKSKEAVAAMALLDADAPSTEQARKHESDLAKQRVRELRGELFSYGEASLTRKVLRRFLESPEVRLLLPPELQELPPAGSSASRIGRPSVAWSATARRLTSAAGDR
jgi:hypothetical protein